MSTAPETTTRPELNNGDHMSQEEFHRIYEQMPEDFRAELIGGIVYVSSPMKRRHGRNLLPLGSLLFTYESRTPGVESADNTTTILDEGSEPQPDLLLRILPECGGQSATTENDYVKGPPELVAEIADSSRSIDLHSKYEDYREHGVLEYLVVSLNESKLRWFDLQADEELSPDEDGIIRIRTFPGLWIDPAALLARDYTRMMATLEEGMASAEYREFARDLAGREAQLRFNRAQLKT